MPLHILKFNSELLSSISLGIAICSSPYFAGSYNLFELVRAKVSILKLVVSNVRLKKSSLLSSCQTEAKINVYFESEFICT